MTEGELIQGLRDAGLIVEEGVTESELCGLVRITALRKVDGWTLTDTLTASSAYFAVVAQTEDPVGLVVEDCNLALDRMEAA